MTLEGLIPRGYTLVAKMTDGVMGQLPETFLVVAGDLSLLLRGRNDIAKDRAVNLWPTTTFFKCPRKITWWTRTLGFPWTFPLGNPAEISDFSEPL